MTIIIHINNYPSSNSLINISSVLKPSASALKFVIKRCPNTGFAIALISSISGAGLPSKIAFAFAPKTKYCDALGPAPQSIQSLIVADDLSELGLVYSANENLKIHMYIMKPLVI